MMDTEMEFLPINNIKQEKEAEAPTSVCRDENNSNNSNTAAEQPDSVENKNDDQNALDKDFKMSRKCCWCQTTLTTNDRPKLLECFHSSCETCIKQEQNKIVQLGQSNNHIVVTCPACKMDSRNDFIIENQFLIEMLESLQIDDNSGNGSTDETAKCANDCASPATSYCVECEALICDSCVQHHQLLKITKDHTIKSKDAAENKSDKSTRKEIKCKTHPAEYLNVYCETCNRLTCRDCQLLEHNSHKYKFVKDMATETRVQLQGLLGEINYKKVLLSSAMQVIDERQALIAEKKTELSKEIHDLVAKLANAVSSRGKQLLFRLNQVCEHKLQVLGEKKDTLQQINSHTDHCINFVQNVLDNASDTAVLYSKKTLSKHLTTVKCQRADIPNPEVPVRIQLFLSNVPELENVISRIGTILVDGKPYPPMPQPAQSGNSLTPPTANNPLQQMNQQLDSRSQQQQQQQQQQQPNLPQVRQRQSPNITTPPLRPLLPQGAPNPTYSNSSTNIFGPGAPQFPGNIRNFPVTDSGRFAPGIPPQLNSHSAMGPPQSHVTSSTDPHMRNDNLRGLLSHTNPTQYNPNHMSNFGQNMGIDTRNMSPAQQQSAALQMRQYMNSFNNGNTSQQNGNMPPGANSALQIQRYQQMNNRQQLLNQMMNTQNIMAPNMKTTSMRYPPGSQPPGMSSNQPNLNPIAMQQQKHMAAQIQQQQQQVQQQQQQQSQQQSAGGSSSSGAKWHTPQQKQSNSSGGNPLSLLGMSSPPNPLFPDSFKIPLKSPDTLRQNSNTNGSSTSSPSSGNFPLPNVTSTNPKTPSPSSQNTQQKDLDSIDSVCSKSVDDLLATIAKLDSNGVQVLPEGRNKATSPQVHSSTDTIDQNNSITISDKNNQPKDDPNEDWCACCMDGGELMCCDKCPKVFHQTCHIPVISSLPDESETWQCLLCYNFADAAPDHIGEKRGLGLSTFELKTIQRITLEMYCQFELSSYFRVLPPPENARYYEQIAHPISLNCIREKLDPTISNSYKSIQAFIDDCRLIFSNAYQFYNSDTKIHSTAQDLEKFFEIQVKKLLPKYAKSPLSRSNSQHQFQPMSLQDLMDDENDEQNEDDFGRNSAKRKRSTPSV